MKTLIIVASILMGAHGHRVHTHHKHRKSEINKEIEGIHFNYYSNEPNDG